MFTKKFEKQLYAIMRIVIGFVFLWHGSQKLFGFPPLPPGIKVPIINIIIAGPIEFFGGILIMIGLFTHWAAFLASGEMAYAYWTVHIKMGLLPLVNFGELAVVYCFVFLYFSARGSGIWSIDNLIKKRHKVSI